MSQKANKYYQEAFELEEQGQYEEAIKKLDKAIELNPKLEQAYLDRAIDKAVLEDYKGAIADLDMLLNLQPKAIEPYVWRAEYKRMLEKYQEAMLDVEKALALKNPTMKGDEIVGPAEFNSDQLYPQGDNYNIELEFIVFERGACNYHLGNYQQALQDLNFCIENELFPKNTRYYRGITHLAIGNKAEGCEDLKIAYAAGELAAKEVLEEECDQSAEEIIDKHLIAKGGTALDAIKSAKMDIEILNPNF